MKGYVGNIEQETLNNENYRKVLYTANKSQLVVMTIQPGDEIGEETHDLDQFIRIEAVRLSLRWMGSSIALRMIGQW